MKVFEGRDSWTMNYWRCESRSRLKLFGLGFLSSLTFQVRVVHFNQILNEVFHIEPSRLDLLEIRQSEIRHRLGSPDSKLGPRRTLLFQGPENVSLLDCINPNVKNEFTKFCFFNYRLHSAAMIGHRLPI